MTTTRRKTARQSLRRTGHTDPPHLRAVCVPRLHLAALSCFQIFTTPSLVTSLRPYLITSNCALAGDDHFAVVPCLARVDTPTHSHTPLEILTYPTPRQLAPIDYHAMFIHLTYVQHSRYALYRLIYHDVTMRRLINVLHDNHLSFSSRLSQPFPKTLLLDKCALQVTPYIALDIACLHKQPHTVDRPGTS